MSYLYSPEYLISKGLYWGGTITPVRVFDDETADWFLDLEWQWRKSLPKLSEWKLKEIMGLLPSREERKGMAARLDKDEIRGRADIVAVYQRLHPGLKVVERYGHVTAQAFCHDDQRPSLSIHKERKLWICHVCSEGGDVIRLVEKSLNLPFVSALDWLDRNGG